MVIKQSKLILEIVNIEEISESLFQSLKDFISNAYNSTAFHDLELNLFISKYFSLNTYLIYATRLSKIEGLLLFSHQKNDKIIISPYQRSLITYGGPICLKREDDYVCISMLKELKRKHRYYSLYIKSGPATDYRIYKKTGFKIIKIPTLLINVEKSEEDLWKNIDNRIKRNIKKAWKSNINVFWDNGENIVHLSEIYTDLCKRKQLFYHGEEYYDRLTKAFSSDTKMRIFYASINGEIISAMSVLEHKETINPWFGGTKKEYVNTGAGSLIYWEILKYACIRKVKIYDFLGLDKGSIAFYKRGFGGIEMDVCHASYLPLYFKILRKLRKLTNKG